MHRVLGILLFLVTHAFAASAEAPVGPDDDFSPMLFMMAIFAVLIMLVLLGICLAIAAITAACLLVLVALGILSTSALIGIFRRKFSSGLRALHYQVCAAVSLPVGAALAWLGVWLFDANGHLPVAIAIGALSGVCAGLTIAYILDRAVTAAYQYFGKRNKASQRIGQTDRTQHLDGKPRTAEP
jgi:hypothetical protein